MLRKLKIRSTPDGDTKLRPKPERGNRSVLFVQINQVLMKASSLRDVQCVAIATMKNILLSAWSKHKCTLSHLSSVGLGPGTVDIRRLGWKSKGIY